MRPAMAGFVERIQARAARRLLSIPPPLLSRIAGPLPRYRGAVLDPRVQVALRLKELVRKKPIETMSPAEARIEQRALAGVFDVARVEIDRAYDDRIAGVPVRIYRPSPGEHPYLIYYHGGGFVLG